MINIGQLAREKYGKEQVYLAGFGTYSGSVIAGEGWGEPMQELPVPPARAQSIEDILHRESPTDRYLLFGKEDAGPLFGSPVRHRAIGVVYHPEHERNGNYVSSVMRKRYDAFIYIDRTSAVHPLGLPPNDARTPDLYPFGV